MNEQKYALLLKQALDSGAESPPQELVHKIKFKLKIEKIPKISHAT